MSLAQASGQAPIPPTDQQPTAAPGAPAGSSAIASTDGPQLAQTDKPAEQGEPGQPVSLAQASGQAPIPPTDQQPTAAPGAPAGSPASASTGGQQLAKAESLDGRSSTPEEVVRYVERDAPAAEVQYVEVAKTVEAPAAEQEPEIRYRPNPEGDQGLSLASMNYGGGDPYGMPFSSGGDFAAMPYGDGGDYGGAGAVTYEGISIPTGGQTRPS